MLNPSTLDLAALTLNTLSDQIYFANEKKGWYKDPKTGRRFRPHRNIPEMLALIHSEISEGLEGWRKDLSDNHLPQHKMLTVEMADALVRIFDLMGYIRNNPNLFPEYEGLDLGRAFCEKIIYNGTRADHKLENRAGAGGKKC
jgi:hypothetical protein